MRLVTDSSDYSDLILTIPNFFVGFMSVIRYTYIHTVVCQYKAPRLVAFFQEKVPYFAHAIFGVKKRKSVKKLKIEFLTSI